MGLPIYVDFAPFEEPLTARVRSLTAPAPRVVPAAHVHIGRPSSAASLPAAASHGVLLEKGTTGCPCEINLAHGEIAGHLVDDGAGADVFIVPSREGADLRLDVLLQRTTDGVSWVSEPILSHCCCAGVRRAAELPELAELGGRRARVQIRCVARDGASVRVWANEPRAARGGARTALGGA